MELPPECLRWLRVSMAARGTGEQEGKHLQAGSDCGGLAPGAVEVLSGSSFDLFSKRSFDCDHAVFSQIFVFNLLFSRKNQNSPPLS